MNKLISFLNASLKESRKINSRFQINLPESEKEVVAKNFQNEILNILDYMYTNFPVNRSLVGDYFPRSRLSENNSEYTNRVKEFSKKKKSIQHPKQVIDFLQYFYELNKKYKSAISYIKGKVKHKTRNQFNEKSTMKLDAELTSNHPAPIHKLSDGSISIAGVGRFHKGSNITMNNCEIYGGGFSTVIKKLEYKEIKITGDEIIFDNGNKFKFNEWAINCITICEQLIKKFQMM